MGDAVNMVWIAIISGLLMTLLMMAITQDILQLVMVFITQLVVVTMAWGIYSVGRLVFGPAKKEVKK